MAQTNKQADIATSKLNRPKGRFSENHKSYPLEDGTFFYQFGPVVLILNTDPSKKKTFQKGLRYKFLPDELEPHDDDSAACGSILVIFLSERSFVTDLAVCSILFCQAVD